MLYKATFSDTVISERHTARDIHSNIIQKSNSGMSESTNVHHDNLQGTVFEDTENSQEQSAFAHRQNGHWYFQTYQSCSFGLYYCVYLLLCASLRLLYLKM